MAKAGVSQLTLFEELCGLVITIYWQIVLDPCSVSATEELVSAHHRTDDSAEDGESAFMVPDHQPPSSWEVHKWLTHSLQAIIVLGLMMSVFEHQWLNTAIIAGILLMTVLPVFFSRGLNVYIPPEFELATIAFIFAALFLGETRDYYGRFWWWDLALHTTSGGLLGVLGVLVVYVLNENPSIDLRMQPAFVAFFAFCFAVAVGALWEIFEFAMDRLFGMTMQKPMFGDPSGLTDTMWDLIVNSLGALIVSVIGYLYMKRGVKSLVERWIERFIDGNPRLFGRK